jgi:hypothetical protein
MTIHQILNMSSTIVTSGAGMLLCNLDLSPVFSGICIVQSLVFFVVSYGPLCFSVHVLLSIVLSSVLQFTTSDYPFGIKLFLLDKWISEEFFNGRDRTNGLGKILFFGWKYMDFEKMSCSHDYLNKMIWFQNYLTIKATNVNSLGMGKIANPFFF